LFKFKPFWGFLVLVCLVMACFLFFFSPLIFSGELPVTENPSSSPGIRENGENPSNLLEGENNDPGITGGKSFPVDTPAAEPRPEELPPSSKGEKVLPEHFWDETLIEKISFLKSPLPGASVSSRDSHLPGAPRSYRNGFHEGLDYYTGACGINVNLGDPVFAAGPGIVYRIDHNYKELSVEEREELLKICAGAGNTPEDILDKLRGRQVWLVHPHGVITRYAHLSEVAENLQEGDTVETGDFIGAVGNSGTSEGAAGDGGNFHLHFEIWVGDSYLGEGLSLQEIRELWERVLN